MQKQNYLTKMKKKTPTFSTVFWICCYCNKLCGMAKYFSQMARIRETIQKNLEKLSITSFSTVGIAKHLLSLSIQS